MNSTVAVVGKLPEFFPTCHPDTLPMPPSARKAVLLVVPKVVPQVSLAISGSTRLLPFQLKVGGVAPHFRNLPTYRVGETL